ncbi:MAG: 4-(cytidine 5'-diphospho)-2-C-methyl-D-erythritol kinase [Puniceicoccales bacterium]|jgi:4-diphosphocytidyl-2-C-methyl-D-erythritol kinase|nr:4-(cytidine 5'-diphospho)-2-C-methyl-D-erythritol kinase [Puniceicoccales bacterium]
MDEFRVFLCPAKLNLFLEVNGKREDSYHNLTSISVQIDFADRMQLRLTEDDVADDFIFCDVREVPIDGKNSIRRAIDAFRRVYPFPRHLVVRLEKNIPIGSGLGGGSSDAAYLLKNLNELLARPLGDGALISLAATVGSDCPLFLSSSPCIVRGRGERVERVNVDQLEGLRRTKFLIFKPSFGTETAQVYEVLSKKAVWTLKSQGISETSVFSLLRDLKTDCSSSHFFNAFQEIVAEKFIELARVFADIAEYFGVNAQLTGTGSAGFIPLADDYDTTPLKSYLAEVIGEKAFVIEAKPLLFP